MYILAARAARAARCLVRGLCYLAMALWAVGGFSPISVAQPAAASGDFSWSYELGDLLSPDTDYMSCAWAPGKGWYAGAYTNGEARVAHSAGGQAWDGRYAWHSDATESVSTFLHPAGQVHAFTESPDGPAAYVIPEAGGEMQRLARWGDGLLYAFAGPGGRAGNTVGLATGHRRQTPGYLVSWNGSGYVRDSPDLSAGEAGPLIPWDSAEFGGVRVAGCALAWDYKGPDAGRIMVEAAGGWEASDYHGPGVLQVRTYAAYPGMIFASNTAGQIYSSTNGYNWSLHRAYAGEAYLLEVAGRPLVATARGNLYWNWAAGPTLSIPGAHHLALAADPNGFILAGPITMSGDGGSRTVKIRMDR